MAKKAQEERPLAELLKDCLVDVKAELAALLISYRRDTLRLRRLHYAILALELNTGATPMDLEEVALIEKASGRWLKSRTAESKKQLAGK